MNAPRFIYPIIVIFAYANVLTAQVGIGTTTPDATLQVVGTLHVTSTLLVDDTDAGAATKLSGVDAAGFLTDVTLGSNLTLSGGTLSASSGASIEEIVLINEAFGTKNNWNIGLAGANSDVTVFIIRKASGGNELKIRGIVGGSDGRRIRIINDSSKKIKFEEDKSEAATGNKIYIYTRISEMTAYGSCELIYSTAISDDTVHWMIVQLDDN